MSCLFAIRAKTGVLAVLDGLVMLTPGISQLTSQAFLASPWLISLSD